VVLTNNSVLFDSATAKTMFNHLKWFTRLSPLVHPMVFTSSTGEDGYSYHVGAIEITVKNDQGQKTRIIIDGAYYAPNMPINLVSGKAIAEQNKFWDHQHNRIYSATDPSFKIPMVYKGDVPVILADVPVDFDETRITPSMAVMASINYPTMHKRLLHAGKAAVLKACKDAGIELQGQYEDHFCEPCVLAKQTDEFPKRTPPACSKPLEFVRIDLVIHQERGHLNYLYTLHFVDVFSGFHWVKFAVNKSDSFKLIKDWLAMVERQTGLKVKMLGLDGGTEFGQSSTEFRNGKLTTWSDQLGVEVWKTTKHTPWFNGKSERAGKEIMERARTIMIDNNIPHHLWPFVVESVMKILNLLPTKGNPGMKSPHEVFSAAVGIPQTSVMPYIRHLRTYFCDAYYYVKKQDRKDSDKWTPRGKKGKLIGYGDLHGRIYYIWNPDEGVIVRASAVRFNEDTKPSKEEEELPLEVQFSETTVEEVQDFFKCPIRVPIGKGTRSSNQQQDQQTFPPQSAATKSILKPTTASGQSITTKRVDFLTPEPTPPPTRFQDPEPQRRQQSSAIERQRAAQDRAEYRQQAEYQNPFQDSDNDDYYDLDEENPIPSGRETFKNPDNYPVEEAPQEMPPIHDPIQSIETDETPQLPEQQTAKNKKTKKSSTATTTTNSNPQEESSGRSRRQRPPPGFFRDLNSGKTRPSYLSQATIFNDMNNLDDFNGHLPIQLHELCLSAVKVTHDLDTIGTTVPKNFRQAQRLPNYKTYWLPAMEAQLRSLQERGVFELVTRKRGMKVLPGKWVYDEKIDQTTGIKTARARWVVCGNFDTSSWNMEDLYAAVTNSTSFRIFMTIIAIMGLLSEQFDFKTAFLNAGLRGDIYYVEQPRGLSTGDALVWLLKKALYGLRRSPQYWFDTIMPVLKSMGFEPFNQDTCIFKNEKTGVLLLLYVDDVLIAARQLTDIHLVRDQLMKHFELKEMGEIKRYLGFDVVRDYVNNTVFISQQAYTKTILAKFTTLDDSSSKALCPWPSKYEIPRQWEPHMQEAHHYIKQTGSLLYLSTGTRPDITYTISRLCEGNAGPGQEHLTVLKHLYRYLKTTSAMGLILGGKMKIEQMGPIGYGDASYADDLSTRHSTGGHVVFFGGGPVFWKTKKQTFVALSTTEAEFCNLTPTAKSAQWVAEVVKQFGVPINKPIVVFTDSANARIHVLNPQKAARTRCIDIRYKWLIEQTRDGVFDIKYMKGEEMPADGLTKPLQREKHEKFVKQLGMASMEVPWLRGKDN